MTLTLPSVLVVLITVGCFAYTAWVALVSLPSDSRSKATYKLCRLRDDIVDAMALKQLPHAKIVEAFKKQIEWTIVLAPWLNLLVWRIIRARGRNKPPDDRFQAEIKQMTQAQRDLLKNYISRYEDAMADLLIFASIFGRFVFTLMTPFAIVALLALGTNRVAAGPFRYVKGKVRRWMVGRIDSFPHGFNNLIPPLSGCVS